MRSRDEHAHKLIKHALAQGYLDSGAVYPVDDFPSHEIANHARLSLNRGGHHLNVATPSWVVDQDGNPCYKACMNPDAPHGLRFRLHSKISARAHVIRESGGDPASLKYNPFARAEGPIVDDKGGRLSGL